ncbi:MAG TPA: hypothetical protein VMT75_02330 [Candidatus Saccharimonadales bacterium]|nr:hypothetical protein [Candidatus Saccharimonadales bacterium]
MRAIRIEVVRERSEMPLVLRARFERTFFGLGLSFATVLLAGGAYLLDDAVSDPLEASATAVLVAGLSLALGGFAIVYLVWPRRYLSIARRGEVDQFDGEWKNYALTAYGESVQDRLEAQKILEKRRGLPGPM